MLSQRRRIAAPIMRRASRSLSTLPLPLPASALIAVNDVVHAYLAHAQFARELENLSGLGLGHVLRRMGEVHIRATFHALAPFQYTPDVAGLTAYSQASMSAMSDPADAQELNDVHERIWQTIIAKAFKVNKPKFLDQAKARRVSLAISGAMQSANSLQLAEEFGKATTSNEEHLKATDTFYDKVIVPCYQAGMRAESMPGDTETFGVVYGSLQVYSQRDRLVAQHLQSGLWALGEKAPLLGIR